MKWLILVAAIGTGVGLAWVLGVFEDNEED